MNRTLLKLGGSLLELPDLVERLLALLDGERIEQPAVVVGGGPAADLIRKYDTRFGLSAQASHRLAIHAMALNARLVAELHSGFVLISTPEEFANFTERVAVAERVAIIDPVPMLASLEASFPDAMLPDSWDTTSDSIAAWMCSRLNLSRLLLLKSADLPFDASDSAINCQQALLGHQLVDRQFAAASRDVGIVDWCNLRSTPANFTVTSLR